MTLLLGANPCTCGLKVTLYFEGPQSYRVQHGDNPEHAKFYDAEILLVRTGYRPWVTELHERQREEAVGHG